jgi:F-type H+-transporting ATPase subunit b
MHRFITPALLPLLLGLVLVGSPAVSSALSAQEESAPHQPEAEGHSAPGGTPNFLEFKPELALATLIVFVLLLIVLRIFAWGPLMKALHDREHNLEHTLLETERARDEAAELLKQHKAQLDQAQAQVRAMLDEARQHAQILKDDMVRQAQDEAEAARQRAEREIGAARDQALMELWNRASDLAVSVAGKVLPRELSDEDHRRLIAQAIDQLPQIQTASRGGSQA